MTGSKGVLKGSQAYPENYGKAVVEVFAEEYSKDEITDEPDVLEDYMPQTSDLWQDAWAKEIMESLQLPLDKLVQTRWPA